MDYDQALANLLFALKFGTLFGALFILAGSNFPLGRRLIAAHLRGKGLAKTRSALADDGRWSFFGQFWNAISSVIPLR
jgi:hypothetical protein